MYELFIGEIGIPHETFLYKLNFWQSDCIIRGYRRRDMLRNQLLAEVVYASIHVMRDPKGKTAKSMFPMLFPDSEEDEEDFMPISDEEAAELQKELQEYKLHNPFNQ